MDVSSSRLRAPDDGIAGLNVLVTGAGRNIGRAIALAFAARGANVAVNARSNIDQASAVRDEIAALGGRAIVAMGDVGDPAQDEAIIKAVNDELGPIDVLVTSAGVRPRQAFMEISVDDWDRVIRSNLSALFYLSRLVLPSMASRGFGRVISIGGPDGMGDIVSFDGPTGLRGWSHRAHNVTCKRGLTGLIRAIAIEFGTHGITANVVAPGMTDTSRDAKDNPHWPPPDDFLQTFLCVPRVGTAEEIADACTFLASTRAGYITGQTLHVNGGIYMP